MRRELEYSSDEYDEEIEMEPRPSIPRAHHPILRIRSHAGRRAGGRNVGFEGVPERAPTRKEGTVAEGSNGRSQQRENTEVNLPPLLAAHLGRTEGGVPLQPPTHLVWEVTQVHSTQEEVSLPLAYIPSFQFKVILQTFIPP